MAGGERRCRRQRICRMRRLSTKDLNDMKNPDEPISITREELPNDVSPF